MPASTIDRTCTGCLKTIPHGSLYFNYGGQNHHLQCARRKLVARLTEDKSFQMSLKQLLDEDVDAGNAVLEHKVRHRQCEWCNQEIVYGGTYWKRGQHRFHTNCFLERLEARIAKRETQLRKIDVLLQREREFIETENEYVQLQKQLHQLQLQGAVNA